MSESAGLLDQGHYVRVILHPDRLTVDGGVYLSNHDVPTSLSSL